MPCFSKKLTVWLVERQTGVHAFSEEPVQHMQITSLVRTTQHKKYNIYNHKHPLILPMLLTIIRFCQLHVRKNTNDGNAIP